jgi:hypothetical protein
MTGARSTFLMIVILAAHVATAAHVDAQPNGDEGQSGDVSQRQRAEDLAREASERFTEILTGDDEPKIAGDNARDAEALDPVWTWLGQAARAYRGIIITTLRQPSGEVVILTPPGGASPKVAAQVAEADAAQEMRQPGHQVRNSAASQHQEKEDGAARRGDRRMDCRGDCIRSCAFAPRRRTHSG